MGEWVDVVQHVLTDSPRPNIRTFITNRAPIPKPRGQALNCSEDTSGIKLGELESNSMDGGLC
jgi:hypothetical protein